MGVLRASVRISTAEMGTGLQESDLLDRLPDGPVRANADTDHIRLVSLGCNCGPKLSFKKIGRGSETLPLDWCRTRIEGVLHFLRTNFEGFFEYTTKAEVPGSTMVMYRHKLHSFWHDDPTDLAMQERYRRRFDRFMAIDAHSAPVLFVRGMACTEEILRAGELLQELKQRFGPQSHLLIVADHQKTVQGASLVQGYDNLLIYSLGSEAHRAGDGAPYTEPVLQALDWAAGKSIQGRRFLDLDTVLHYCERVRNGFRATGGFDAFEEESSSSSSNVAAPEPPLCTAALSAYVSLGCDHSPKLALQTLGLGTAEFPFDWLRTSSEGVLHHLRTEFSDLFKYDSKHVVPESGITMWRSRNNSFWGEDPSSGEVQKEYKKRIEALQALRQASKPILFVRIVASVEEIIRVDGLLGVLSDVFGEKACLLLAVPGQPECPGTYMVDGREDLLIHFMETDDSSGTSQTPLLCEAIKVATEWISGRPFAAAMVPDVQSLHACAEESINGLVGSGGLCAFEGWDMREAPLEMSTAASVTNVEEDVGSSSGASATPLASVAATVSTEADRLPKQGVPAMVADPARTCNDHKKTMLLHRGDSCCFAGLLPWRMRRA